MVVLIKFVLFVSVLFTRSAVIQSTGLTWFEAQRCCASRSGQLATIDDSVVSCNNIQSEAATLWTGNIRKPSEWIEFQGCYELNGPMSNHNNISECYKKCLDKQQNSFKFFSYKENQCICQFIDNITITDNKNLCLSEAQTKHSWVYKVLYNTSFHGYGNCVASKCTNGSEKRVAERCTSLQIPMCGLASSPTYWTKCQRNCKTPTYMENHATDICKLNKETTETGMWTNTFRVEIPAHVDHANNISMKEISSCVVAECPNNIKTIEYRHTKCNETADGFFCKSVDNSTIISSVDCIRQTTKVHNISKAHSTGQSTVSSSISRYSFSSSHHSTKTWKTDNKEISKVSVNTTVSASITKLNGNFVSKRTTYSSSLGTAKTSDKLPVIRSVGVLTTHKPSYTITDITPTMNEHVGNKPEATNIGLICGVAVGGVVLIAVIAIFACKMRNAEPFRKRLYNEGNIEMNNSIDCAIPVYHDTVMNTNNGDLPKNAIRNNTAESTSTGGERQNSTYFSSHEYAVVKKHPAGPAAQPSEFDLEGSDTQSQRFETEDEYDTLKHTVDKGEEEIENNVYDSSLGVCDGDDPTYNSIKIGPVNDDTTYDHISNIVQIQVNNDTTYDHTSNIIQQ